MNMRIEKNRKHCATLIAAILGITLILVVNQLWTFPSQQMWVTFWAAIGILVVRSVVIEAGIRRPANGIEKHLDRVGVEIAEKHLGIVILPHDRKTGSNAEKNSSKAEQASSSNGG